MKKLLVALILLCLPASAQACPPGQQFGLGFGSFGFGCPQMSVAAFDVPVVEFVPQVRLQRQFVIQQSFVMPICPQFQSIQPFNNFASSQNYGSFGFNNFNSFGSFGGCNNFRGFNGFEGGRNTFVGRGFEFSGSDNPRRLNIRESPRGGIRIRERGGR